MVSYGYNFSRPRTQINLDSSLLGSANALSEKPIVLIGSATGGQPQVPVKITNFAQAKETFISGDLLDAIEMAWNPSPTAGGAGTIYAMRSDSATQSTYTSGGLAFSSDIYGTVANGIQVSLSDDVSTGSKMVQVVFNQNSYNQTYDNLGNMFTIQYKGSQAAAQVAIAVDATTKLATTLTLSAGAAGSTIPVKVYALGAGLYQDINVLINDIANLPDWTITPNTLGGSKNIQTQFLDVLAAVDAKTAAVNIKAVGADIAFQLQNDPYVNVVYTQGGAITNFGLAFLAGGTVTVAPADWSSLFAQVSNVGAYYIVPLTSNNTVHAQLSQFLRDQSNQGNQLRGLVGAGDNETVQQLKSRQIALRNSRITLFGNSGTRSLNDGRVLSFQGYHMAALIGGLASGLPIGEPITFKRLQLDTLDQQFTSDNLDQLDATGVVMIEFVRTRQSSYFRVVSDPTTYNVTTDPVQNRMSLGETSDYLTTELRILLDEQFIGTALKMTSASIMKNAVESFLDQQKSTGGLIVNYNPDDVQVIITGNTARINLTVQPAQGLDYINVYVTYNDVSLSA